MVFCHRLRPATLGLFPQQLLIVSECLLFLGLFEQQIFHHFNNQFQPKVDWERFHQLAREAADEIDRQQLIEAVREFVLDFVSEFVRESV